MKPDHGNATLVYREPLLVYAVRWLASQVLRIADLPFILLIKAILSVERWLASVRGRLLERDLYTPLFEWLYEIGLTLRILACVPYVPHVLLDWLFSMLNGSPLHIEPLHQCGSSKTRFDGTTWCSGPHR